MFYASPPLFNNLVLLTTLKKWIAGLKALHKNPVKLKVVAGNLKAKKIYLLKGGICNINKIMVFLGALILRQTTRAKI